ncbi:hypothetical protein MBR_09401, partial [Metarhizium brunneum ARSEF 3297]
MALHFLAGVVLTAPQQQRVAGDIRPFKKVPTDFTGCFEPDVIPLLPPVSGPIGGKHWQNDMLFSPPLQDATKWRELH